MRYFLDMKIRGNLVIEKIYAQEMPVPFLSVLTNDCISRGKDYNAGGARYNTSYIQGVGIGTITDCLAAIKYNVFDHSRFSMKELMDALKNDLKVTGKYITWFPTGRPNTETMMNMRIPLWRKCFPSIIRA